MRQACSSAPQQPAECAVETGARHGGRHVRHLCHLAYVAQFATTAQFRVGITRATAPFVSLPRHVVPGATYLITRRCYQRTFRLRPSPVTNAIVLYCLAWALSKTGVVLHATCFMSNHHHLVVTDVRGVLPDFLRELHRSIAKALNASQGQWENLWSAEQTGVVRLGTQEDILAKMAYVVGNPVEAGLVERPEQWPGVILWGDCVLNAPRPDDYFDPLGSAPASLKLRVAPPARAGESASRGRLWQQSVKRAVAERVAWAWRRVRAEGVVFLGREAVLAQSFIKRAHSYEVKREPIPRVVAKDPLVRRALWRVEKAFRAAYRVALEKWRLGLRHVSFPTGTWLMRVHHRVPTAALPAPA